MRGRADWLIRWFSLLLAGLLFSLTLSTDALAPMPYLIINQGLFLTVVAFLLLPAADSISHLLVNTSAAVTAQIILSQLSIAGAVPLTLLFQICVIILCLSLFLWSLTQLLTTVSNGKLQARKPILISAVFITSAPCWLGPLVDIYQPGVTATNAIISITPLTHFSVAASYDYLRTEWFYQNTPFGSLPFVYPDLISTTAAYLLLVLVLQTLRWQLIRQNKFTRLNLNF